MHGTVFLTGGAVLVLEIIGTRFLAPFYGTNLYAWSALISVTLLSLALGYYFGGRLADSRGSPALLDQVIGASAIGVTAIPLAVQALADPLAATGARTGVVLSAAVCFGPSLTILGMITPVAVRIAAPDFAHLGRSVGSVYAWSTAGSIAGALAAGFVLLPSVRVTRICYAVALALLVLALARWLVRSRFPLLALIPPVALALVGAAWNGFPENVGQRIGSFRVAGTYPSFYGTVKVLEDKAVRYLVVDGMCQNAQAISRQISVLPYVGVFGALPLLRPGGKDLLLIGLGAGDMVRMLGESGILTTAVEIDPVVARVAYRHFGLRPEDLRLVIDDGRNFLRRQTAQYDFLILDAFAGGSPASHLFSQEAFREMRTALRPAGVLGVNMVTRSTRDALVADLTATIRSVFGHVVAVSTAHEPASLGNVIFFASDQPLELPAPFLEKAPRRQLEIDSLHGRLITDDWNRIDVLAAPTEEEVRRQSRAALPAALLVP